ncbi:DUF4097 family beta strand repeat-containing protein [Cellulomonas fengjieae]|uniref:DUF4097 family beta strand repeat protein n=1 Tax=Cellulomonas fengjieae TaxID=2819978 RepID=A0ABS3SCT6_9CELL|nr:DUF4097 family beta strand repeat-containing protein [Cellulomonas fengjieae]MBO3083134.1 DUF4097 family beta strand repeat protein [Cellulomonas fengjieae]MBO3102119.1 DUF4097 family beta strand repeat protein [Cellulomonas fengjieae]QVI65501.1 DUF4097 family beta strand repeat protein [Cellulomonas fengjieae]
MTSTLERPADATSAAPRSPAARALTWIGGVVGGLLLLFGAYSAVDLLVLGSDDVTTASQDASYGAARVVELEADGLVTVTTGGDRVQVARSARSALSTPTYRADESGDRLRVSYRCDWWRPGFCSTSLDVTVPEGTAVVVRSHDGSVTATALSGPLEIDAADGDPTISDIDGDVTVRVADGRVDVSDVRGNVSLQSADGAVTVARVSGSVTTRSSDGRTEISGVQGDVDAQAADGDVTVYGTGRPVALDITTADGGQTVEGPVDPTSSTHVRIRVNDGHAAYLRPRG